MCGTSARPEGNLAVNLHHFTVQMEEHIAHIACAWRRQRLHAPRERANPTFALKMPSRALQPNRMDRFVGAGLVPARLSAYAAQRATTTRAFTPVFDGLRVAPTNTELRRPFTSIEAHD
jgi:hypothetical protein